MMTPRPFVKWTGGKTQLLSELVKRVPEQYGTYHEPFAGGAALFFFLKPAAAVLYDANEDLMAAFLAVRDACPQLVSCLRNLAVRYAQAPETVYYEIRSEHPDDPIDRAARALFLNKTCFNGLWRVNRSGQFNVPIGRYAKPTICDEENLIECSAVLRSAAIVCGDFLGVEQRATPGDFVYFDPPYVPVSKTSNFTAYTAGGFTPAAQVVLRDLALRLKRAGVHVLLSNSGSETVDTLYGGGEFIVERVSARRNINSRGDRRGAVEEFLIY